MLQLYLWCIMDPLSIYKELVLVFSFGQVQDCYKVVVAFNKREIEREGENNFFFFIVLDIDVAAMSPSVFTSY